MKIVWRVIVAITAFAFAGALVIQLPQVQTFAVSKVTELVSEKLDGDITFEKIHLRPFTTLVLKNVVITDRNPSRDPADLQKEPVDTFFRAGYIIAKFSFDGLVSDEGIHIRKAYIGNAQMNLVLEDGPEGSDKGSENLSRIFRLKKGQDKDKQPSDKEIFHIKKVEINDMGFAMINHKVRKTPYSGGINWNDLDISNIHIHARDLMFKGGIMSGEVDQLSFNEKSGFTCKSISGKAKVGNGRTIIEDMRLDDGASDLHLPLYMMSYDSVKDFEDYIAKVRMDAIIDESLIDFKTISYFAPTLEGNGLKAVASGKADGYVNDLRFHNIKARTVADGFSGTVTGRLYGLPDIDKTHIDAEVRDFSLTTEGLSRFVSEWMKKGELDLSRFAKGTTFIVNASADGLLNHMRAVATISSDKGKAEAEALFTDLTKPQLPIGIDGIIRTEDLDLGPILGTDLVHEATLRTGLKARFGESVPEVVIDSLIVDKLHLNGYDYRGIAAAGKLSEKAFDGRIICNDPSLNFLFQGTFALSSKTKNALYQFYANVGHADLQAMNIDKRGISRVQLQTNANFTRTSQGDLLGKIDIGGLQLENDFGKHDIGDISLTSHTSDDKWKVRINSSFADGSYSGTASVGRFVKDLKDITLRKEIPALFRDEGDKWNGNSYELYFRCHNSMDIMSFAIPGIYIADSTALNLDISPEGIMTAHLKSPRIAYRDQYMKGVQFSLDNRDDKISGEMSCNEIRAASMILKDNRFQILAQDNHLGAGYSYENSGELLNRGEFVLVSDFARNQDRLDIDLEILPTTMHLNSREWNIEPSKIYISGGDIDVRSFELTSSEQRIRIEGKASKERKDTLTLNLDRFDISIVNPLIGSDLGIAGAATGDIRLISPMDEIGLLANMICDSTYVAGVPLGVLEVESNWSEEFERFEIDLKNDYSGKSNITAHGKLTPKLKTLEAEADLDELQIGYVQPILQDVFSEMNGSISGKIYVEGPLDNLSISSRNARLNDAELRIDFTNVPYHADGTFHIDNKGAYFDDIKVKDRYDGRGEILGSINWDHFRDMTFDLSAKVTNMECVDLNERQGDVFYGNLYATGNLDITGPLNSIMMDIDAVTSKPGQLHIPLSSALSTGTASNLLKFKEPAKVEYFDPYESMMSKLQKKEQKGGELGVKMRVTASPDVEAFVEIDKASGNILSGRGNGTIDLKVDSENFDITGDYTLTGGNYRFVVLGLASRDFSILDGSSIRFGGDIMESNLDIDATYRTKASLSTLISDTTSVANKRIVDCGISITDKLSNPRLGFSIEIPDLDPMVKSRVESALSTEDKVQKQFLSLIVSNNFLPDEQSGIVNNSSMLYSNVTEILANQLNNIFQKLDIPLDLGLNYQPNERGNDIFDVAVSTQLFNNRVVVNGNIGSRQYSSGNSQNDVVGDIDIEIKLDRSGSLRLNLFSHSADQYTNYLDNSQRNGVGLTYQTEFNSFAQFFRNIFSSKKKRQEAKMLEEEEMINEGKVRIEISAPEKNTERHDRKRKTISDTVSPGRE